MNRKLLEELKLKLKKERELFEKELEKFAERDQKTEGEWDTLYPFFDGQETGSAALEKSADEVEEYETRLPLKQAFEAKLRNIDSALKKIEEDQYGICENCKKQISVGRLKVFPEAKLCINCKGK